MVEGGWGWLRGTSTYPALSTYPAPDCHFLVANKTLHKSLCLRICSLSNIGKGIQDITDQKMRKNEGFQPQLTKIWNFKNGFWIVSQRSDVRLSQKSGYMVSMSSNEVNEVAPKKIGDQFVHETVLYNCWTYLDFGANFQRFLAKNWQFLFFLTRKKWSDWSRFFLLGALASWAHFKIVFRGVCTPGGHK